MTSPRLLRNFARLLTAISVVMLVFLVAWLVSFVFYKLSWSPNTAPQFQRRALEWIADIHISLVGGIGGGGQSLEVFTLTLSWLTLWAVMMQSGLALVLRTLARAAERAARRQPERSG